MGRHFVGRCAGDCSAANTHDRLQVDDGVLRMDVAKLNGQARIEMSADDYDRPAIWESWGTVAITMADGGPGTFKLHRDYNNAKGGGLAAWSAPFTVSFMRTGNSTPNYPLRWHERDFGFHDMVLQLGSPTANDVVTITNDIDLWNTHWYDESGDRGVVD